MSINKYIVCIHLSLYIYIYIHIYPHYHKHVFVTILDVHVQIMWHPVAYMHMYFVLKVVLCSNVLEALRFVFTLVATSTLC